MKKDEMLRTMRMHAHDMKGAIAECEGLKDDILDVPDDAEKLKVDFIKPAYAWICELRTIVWKKYRDVKNLLSDTLWERYKQWGGFEDHRECVLLRESLVAFRKAVRHRDRPDFYKKGKLNAALKKDGNKSGNANKTKSGTNKRSKSTKK